MISVSVKIKDLTRRVVIAALFLAAQAVAARADEVWLAWPDGGRLLAVRVEAGRAGDPSIVASRGVSDYPPSLSLGADGLPAAAWLGEDGAIMFGAFDGRRWSAPETVSASSGLHRGIPSLAIGRDVAAAAWAEAGDLGFEDVWYALRTESGWSEARRAHEANSVPDILPAARMDSGGALGLSWQAFDGERYVEARIGAEVPDPGPGALPPELRDAALDAGLPPETALAWMGEDGTPASTRIRVLLDQDARRGEEADETEPGALKMAAANEIAFLAFGDSITYGRGSSSDGPRTGYPAYLSGIFAYNYPGQPFRVVNRGVPGETTAEGLSRINAVLDGYPYDCVLLMEGTNDINAAVSFETIQENLKQMARRAAARGVIPVFATLIPTHPDVRPEQYRMTRDFYNGGYVQTLARRYRLPCADQWDAFGEIPDWPGVIMDYASGNHPNNNGYRYVMAPRWFETIAPHLPIPFTPTGPGVRIAAAAPIVRRGGMERFLHTLAPGNDMTRNVVDCYAALMNPAGKMYFINTAGRLVSGATPILRGVDLGGVPTSGVLLSLAISRISSLGTFRFYAVAVRPLRSVWDREAWTSNLAEARFAVTP